MRFKKVKVNQTKLCWNEQDLYFHQKTIREYSVKHDSFFHTCLTFCKYVWEKPNLCVKYHTCSFWQMFDFYPTCLEKTKHVGIFTPGCYFPHMFGFWHIGMGKGTHVCKKPHNYMFANVCHFPHMCGKSHWHAYFPLSYGCDGAQRRGDSVWSPLLLKVILPLARRHILHLVFQVDEVLAEDVQLVFKVLIFLKDIIDSL